MSLIRWNPLWDPFQEMEEMMGKAFVPAIDVYETKDAVVVEAPLAGVDPKDVKVTVEKGILTVQGETKKEHEAEEKNFYRKEVRSGSFFRQVALPAAVKEDVVSAEYADGVLKITAPKVQPTAPKKIDVKIAKK